MSGVRMQEKMEDLLNGEKVTENERLDPVFWL